MSKSKPGRALRHKRWRPDPKLGIEFSSITMRELQVKDKSEIARWVDMNYTAAELDTSLAEQEAQITESIRRAIVEVDGELVNVHGVPWAPMNEWNTKTMRFVQSCFYDLNGLDADDVKNAVAAGEEISLAGVTNLAAVADEEEEGEAHNVA